MRHALVKDAMGQEMHKSKGNAIWFDDAVEKIGADVLRWQFFRHDISNDVNFSYENAKILRGNFFNTLWNSYAFYINYARLVGFYPAQNENNAEDRNVFDRWILSKLNTLIKTCRSGIESYDLKTACRSIEDFTDDLSKWYIRHNRRRFWKSEKTGDTLTAYETLFTCIYTLTGLLAPMLPMLTEEIYRNMVYGTMEGAPESIHLTNYPAADESLVNNDIIAEMDIVKNIIALSMSIRNSEKIKVRQPLQQLSIATADKNEADILRRYSDIICTDLNVKEICITDTAAGRPAGKTLKPNFRTLGPRFGNKTQAVAEAISLQLRDSTVNTGDAIEINVNGSPMSLNREDLVEETTDPPHLSIIDYRDGWIALDKTITEELETEGLAREFIRHVQVLRKKSGFEPEDRIEITMHTGSGKIRKSLETYDSFIRDELLCDSISETGNAEGGAEIIINGERIAVSLTTSDAL